MILLVPTLFVTFVPHTLAAYFVRNGPAGTSEFPQWELSYYAVDYKPVCGLSLEKEGSDFWSNCYECEPAMFAFNSSTALDTQVQVYDTTGSITSTELAGGQTLCLCYALLHAADNVVLDICMLFGPNAEIAVRSGPVAAGVQGPDIRKTPLPSCEDVDVATYSSSFAVSTTRNSGMFRVLFSSTMKLP